MISKEEVYDDIQHALSSKTPFSLARLGDGESIAMQYPFKRHKMEYVMNRQFGYVPEDHDMEYISGLVLNAYSNADIIGIPTQVHREKHGYWWASAEDYLMEHNPRAKDAKRASIDVHTDMFHAGMLDRILYGKEHVFIISGRDLDEGLKRKYKIGKITSIKISPEQKFQATKDKERHYPDQFKFIRKWMKSYDFKGCLCLVGAGLLGKSYCSMFKQNGGVALDLGHIFDQWSGKITRGKNKGVHAVDNTYKL